VYPNRPSRLHYRVLVFRNVAEMLTYARRRENPSRPGRFCKAMVSTWTRLTFVSGRERTQPELGEMLFAKRWLGSEVLSHESTHAALGWARRAGVNPGANDLPRRGDEERFCYALGQTIRQLVNGLHAKRLLT
jgi:hypothetical protein